MSKKILVLLLIILFILIFLIIWLLAQIERPDDSSSLSPYSAVYLSTGDIYFGKFSWFPRPHLKEAWFIQRGVDAENKAQLSVAPLNSVFWGPVGELNLNPNMIIFWTKLKNDSQLVQMLNAKNGNIAPLPQTNNNIPESNNSKKP